MSREIKVLRAEFLKSKGECSSGISVFATLKSTLKILQGVSRLSRQKQQTGSTGSEFESFM